MLREEYRSRDVSAKQELCGGNVGVPQPLLYLGNVRVVGERIGGGCGAQRMHTETVHIGVDAHYGPVMLDNLLIHGIRMQVLQT
jgi:hypothetical protein